MRRIRLCQETDLPSLYKCLRRVKEGIRLEGLDYWNDEYPLEEDLKEDFEAGRLYIVKEGGRVIGALAVSHDVAHSFFPESRSEKKAVDLLDKVGHKGEDVLMISRLMIDPAFQKKGIGTEFLKSILANYRHTSFLISVSKRNVKAVSFYKKNGFVPSFSPEFEYGGFPSSEFVLMTRMYRPQGLCKEPLF